ARFAPLLPPHAPLVCALAVQLAFVPLFVPLQLHAHGPLPLTAVAVPKLHRFVVGAAARFAPLLPPHAPLVCGVAVQLAFVPLFVPLQLHVHGPLPLTAVAVPKLHRFVVGAAARFAPLLPPHAPLGCAL